MILERFISKEFNINDNNLFPLADINSKEFKDEDNITCAKISRIVINRPIFNDQDDEELFFQLEFFSPGSEIRHRIEFSENEFLKLIQSNQIILTTEALDWIISSFKKLSGIDIDFNLN